MSKKRDRINIDLDTSVARALASPPGQPRLSTNHNLAKVTVRIPRDLVEQIKQEAYALTHHRRRGFQDLVAIFLHHGLRAYQRGELEVTLREKTVEYQIVAKE